MGIDYSQFNHNKTNIIKNPIVSNKALELIGDNKYTFLVNRLSNKNTIKTALENLFNVKIIKINTSHLPKKMKRVGKYIGFKSQYKKAIVTVAEGYVINIFV